MLSLYSFMTNYGECMPRELCHVIEKFPSSNLLCLLQDVASCIATVTVYIRESNVMTCVYTGKTAIYIGLKC